MRPLARTDWVTRNVTAPATNDAGSLVERSSGGEGDDRDDQRRGGEDEAAEHAVVGRLVGGSLQPYDRGVDERAGRREVGGDVCGVGGVGCPGADVAGAEQTPQHITAQVEGHRHADEPDGGLTAAGTGEQQQHEEEQHDRADGLVGVGEDRWGE